MDRDDPEKRIAELERRLTDNSAGPTGMGEHGFAQVAARPASRRGGNLTLDDTGKTAKIACNDGYLTVSGLSMTVTVTGHCARLTVDGLENHVTVDAVDAIDAEGADNVVVLHSGSPHITKKMGVDNTVQQG